MLSVQHYNKHCCVLLSTCLFIIVFQLYNTTGCPLLKFLFMLTKNDFAAPYLDKSI